MLTWAELNILGNLNKCEESRFVGGTPFGGDLSNGKAFGFFLY